MQVQSPRTGTPPKEHRASAFRAEAAHMLEASSAPPLTPRHSKDRAGDEEEASATAGEDDAEERLATCCVCRVAHNVKQYFRDPSALLVLSLRVGLACTLYSLALLFASWSLAATLNGAPRTCCPVPVQSKAPAFASHAMHTRTRRRCLAPVKPRACCWTM